ncbi:uncharacterized protein LOC123316750 [Coccinella septempunctata]|uniref:uncharacterized protein LOC123316750 n=1 Tax=Coccinella septempunctata TaxID=41139 RepID=UPI001D097472|nr:uncharacterized protein LOC123316750 [Coccinella septempunctata]
MKFPMNRANMKLTLIFLSVGVCMAKKGVMFETAEIPFMDPKYGTATCYSNKYNATTFLVNARVNFTTDLPLDSVVAVDIYKLSDNTYKKTALSMKKKICQFLDSGEYRIMWSSYMDERFNIPKKCPISKGYYMAKDIDPNRLVANELFNFLPSWSIKVEVAITSKNEPIMNMKFRFKVVDAY